jgi:DNA-binding protein H-NS
MARTLSEIQSEINRLKKEADKIRSAEIKEVVSRIRKAIAHYGLTTQDLFGKVAAAAGAAGKGAGRKRGAAKKAKAGSAATAKGPAVVRYRDENGNSWVGRGKRPQWLRDALAAGRKLEEFAAK